MPRAARPAARTPVLRIEHHPARERAVFQIAGDRGFRELAGFHAPPREQRCEHVAAGHARDKSLGYGQNNQAVRVFAQRGIRGGGRNLSQFGEHENFNHGLAGARQL